MRNDFLPIPSLNNLYEVNSKGVVRNAKTKHIIQPMVNLKVEARKCSMSVNTLLWEVHGIRRKDAYAKKIPVSIRKNGEKYYFESYRKCARFLKKVEYCAEVTAMTYLRKHREIIFGWEVKYFDEAGSGLEVERKRKGKNTREEGISDENY